MQATKSMINNYVSYLCKFGTVRIQKYRDSLLKRFEFGPIEKAYIKQLPEYYKQNCPRMEVFIKIMTENNLWYTMYL